MPKKTTTLIIVLLIFTAGLIYIAIQTEKETPPPITEEPVTQETVKDIVPTIQPRTDIFFTPQTIDYAQNPQPSYTTDILINTNGQLISGVQIELSYDPEILASVTINPAVDSIFGTNAAILVNSVDQELGRITLAMAGGLNDAEVSGTGKIATLTFSTNFSTTPSTQISFLPKTTVRSLKSTNSLLKSAQSLTVILNSPTATPTGL